jgi:RNA-directed DNA polymerase
MTHGGRESDRSRVPRKRPNTVEGRTTMRSREPTEAAEAVEGRELAKGKTGEHSRVRTPCRRALHRALDRRRQAARRDHAKPLTALWHHVYDVNRLREADDGRNRAAAPGVDGQTGAASGEHLESKLRALSDRLKRGAYHARPVERGDSPKPDGRQRPIGIPTLEDTSVQRAPVEVLTASDEGECRGCSSGCRPGRSPHEALDAVTGGLEKRPVPWGLDADIRGGLDAIDHAWRGQCIAQRIGDQRVVRPRQPWLHAGVLAEGQWHGQEEGTPQGGRVRPLAAHSSLHDVLERWAARWRRPYARGEGRLVRSADAGIVGCAHRDDAARCWSARRDRMGQCNVELHPEKTRLIECGRCAVERRTRRAQGTPEPCDLLGLTHSWSKTRHGKLTVRRKTIVQRLRKTLRAVPETRRRRMHWPIAQQGAWLQSVLLGQDRYEAVPRHGSLRTVCRDTSMRSWCQTRCRRSQRHRMTGPRLYALAERWLPKPHILPPYPAHRVCVTTRGRSPVRSCRTPGSVRGVPGNRHPYRDRLSLCRCGACISPRLWYYVCKSRRSYAQKR